MLPKNSLDRFTEKEIEKPVYSLVTTNILPLRARQWLIKYLTNEEMASMVWATEYRGKPSQLLVLYSSPSYWIARNFGEGVKYVSSGVKPFILYGKGDVLVLVEDVISAIKVGRQVCSSPMLGAIPLKQHIKHYNQFSKVVLWGDRDKAKENVINSRKLSEILNKPVEVVITEKDPKEYSNEEIEKWLKL